MSQKFQQKLQKQQKKKKQQQKQRAKAASQRENAIDGGMYIDSNVSLEGSTHLVTKFVDFVAGVHMYISSKERNELLFKMFQPLTTYIGENLSEDVVDKVCEFLDYAQKTASELEIPCAAIGATPQTKDEREIAAKALLLRQMLENDPLNAGLTLSQCAIVITQESTDVDPLGHYLFRFPAGDMRGITVSTYDGMVVYKASGDEKYGCALSSAVVSSLRLHGALYAYATPGELRLSGVPFGFDAP